MELRYPDHQSNSGAIEKFAVEICEDCIFRSAGLFEEPDDTDGLFDTCPEWDGWDFHQRYADDDPDQEGEPLHGFSKSSCDGCHTSLGGERYSCTAINWSGTA